MPLGTYQWTRFYTSERSIVECISKKRPSYRWGIEMFTLIFTYHVTYPASILHEK